MDNSSVAYVLCRIEDDSSLTPASEHPDLLTGVAAGGYAVEVSRVVRSFGFGIEVAGHEVGLCARGAGLRNDGLTEKLGLNGGARPLHSRHQNLPPVDQLGIGLYVLAVNPTDFCDPKSFTGLCSPLELGLP